MTALPRGETPGHSAEDPDGSEDRSPEPSDLPEDRSEDGPEDRSEDGPGGGPGLPDDADDSEAAPADDSGGPSGGGGTTGEVPVEATDAPTVTEAQAELAAQRELRERIERRKAEKAGPIAAGTGLSGTAAQLLAAVRAVESGEKTASAFYEAPAAPVKRPDSPVADHQRAHLPQPVRASPAPQEAPEEAVAAVRAVLAGAGAQIGRAHV